MRHKSKYDYTIRKGEIGLCGWWAPLIPRRYKRLNCNSLR
jgi:hypothetical protein